MTIENRIFIYIWLLATNAKYTYWKWLQSFTSIVRSLVSIHLKMFDMYHFFYLLIICHVGIFYIQCVFYKLIPFSPVFFIQSPDSTRLMLSVLVCMTQNKLYFILSNLILSCRQCCVFVETTQKCLYCIWMNNSGDEYNAIQGLKHMCFNTLHVKLLFLPIFDMGMSRGV